MKKEKMSLGLLITFIVLIIFSLVFFSYTKEVTYTSSNGDIVDCTYSIVNLLINSVMMIISIAIIEISTVTIRKLPKDNDDYNKALVISNIIIGTILNLFIIFWPIAQYLLV